MEENLNVQPDLIDISEQNRIRREKLAGLQNEGKDPFVHVKYDVTHHSKKIHDEFESLEGQTVSLAGRIMTRRIMGKASFFDIQDRDGRIQAYIKKDVVSDERYDEFKKLDIGDIVGVRGEVFRTHKGEISVSVSEFILLTKSLQVLPEKFHGLRDTEIRYRQRYLDLIMNPDVKDVFLKRSAIIKGIRAFLDGRDFLEVETPVLQTIPGGAAARPFITHHNALDMDMYLRIALELPLKRLIVGGLERVYELGRVFRNEGLSIKHNPEFTMLELYQAYTDYKGMMELIESLIKKVCFDVTGSYVVNYQDTEIDFEKPFEKISMLDAVKKYSGVDFTDLDLEGARRLAKEHEIEFKPYDGKGDILNLFFEKYAEKNLVQPTFLIDHPKEISHLTKSKPDMPGYTERFELFIVGREFANAYSELNDPIDQRERFKHQESLRESGNDEANMIDEDFLTSLEFGMPPTGGLGLGIDRFVMLLTNSSSIRDVLFFPTMRNIN